MLDKILAVITIITLFNFMMIFRKLSYGKFEKYGYTVMISLAIMAVFIGGILQ